jgi:hypothetical protein
VRSVEDELPGGCACTWGAVFWRGGCATEPACPDDSSGVEGVVPVSSSDPSSDLVNSSGESESCSATADPGGVSICSASTDAAAATTSGFGGGTFRGFMRTGVVADVCPMSKKPGGRGLSGWRHQISCIVATHQATSSLVSGVFAQANIGLSLRSSGNGGKSLSVGGTRAPVEASSDGSSASETGVGKCKAGRGRSQECVELEDEPERSSSGVVNATCSDIPAQKLDSEGR